MRRLASRLRAALAGGGLLLVDAIMADEPPTEWASYITLVTWGVSGGSAHGFDAYHRWLTEAGFATCGDCPNGGSSQAKTERVTVRRPALGRRPPGSARSVPAERHGSLSTSTALRPASRRRRCRPGPQEPGRQDRRQIVVVLRAARSIDSGQYDSVTARRRRR
jgi:hypothetical protein